jgi:hypothetical protein
MTRETSKAMTRERILSEAQRLFRERGYASAPYWPRRTTTSLFPGSPPWRYGADSTRLSLSDNSNKRERK